MCGRIACALGVDDLSCATACKSKGDLYVKTKTHKSTLSSQPSYNVPPTVSVPVLVAAKHNCFQFPNADDNDRLLVNMRFGIIPHWLRLKPELTKSYNNETHLCKIERMRESKLYKPMFEKGYRCAVPCIGYYEWQSTKGANKQPYFFYNKNNSIEDLKLNKGSFDQNTGWTGINLLYLAGLFSIYKDSNGDEGYSFAIITKEASEEWQYVHHRMPVVLQTEEHVHNWIKYSEIPFPAFEILDTEITNLATHPVNKTIVNKTKNNISTCILPIELNKPNKLMMSWLSTGGDKNKTTSIKTTPETNTTNTRKRTSLDSWLTSAQKKPKNN